MQLFAHITEMFKDIFVDEDTGEQSYVEFAKWYINESHLSDSEGTTITDETDFTQLDVPAKKTFYLLAHEYNDSHVSFSVDGFKDHFAIDLYNYYKEFEATTAEIDKLMNLGDTDIKDSGYMVINNADIPEVPFSTSSTENNAGENAEYVSNQQKTINQKGLLQIRREQLSNKRAYTVRQFLAKFRHLFIKVLSSPYNFVVANEE